MYNVRQTKLIVSGINTDTYIQIKNGFRVSENVLLNAGSPKSLYRPSEAI